MAKKLKITFLGGVGEIGKNMTALEYDKDIIVIDAGLTFPNSEEMPGVDYVVPDFTYLEENADKVKAIVLTHGHEDHIGALPFVLKKIDTKVYGSNLAVALVEHKLREQKIKKVSLNVVNERDVISVGAFKVEFIRVNHSIAGAFALAITTPKGVIFHTGDYKIDHNPIDGRKTDLARIAEIGQKGVLLMLQDSTNVEREGFSMSERSVGKSLDAIFAANTSRRLIVATFASNVHRVQQIINCALKYDRRIAFSGRSMENIAQIAHKLKELKFPDDKIVNIDKMDGIPYDKMCIISTGTQGEPESALTRMSRNEFKKVRIGTTDTVVISASPIPGNEKMIYNVINNLYKNGAEVIYKSLAEIHVSGHACQEELKLMLSLVKPKYFIPVHGEYRHLKQHAELAESMGVNAANILIPELGSSIDVSVRGLKRMDKVKFGSIMVDGSIIENPELMMRDRKNLSEDGIVIALANVSEGGRLLTPPVVIARGLNITEADIETIKDAIETAVNKMEGNAGDGADLRRVIKRAAGKILYNKLRKHPMIIPITIAE
ncbi:MAG: ribonuclease J [Bacillota bacterium]